MLRINKRDIDTVTSNTSQLYDWKLENREPRTVSDHLDLAEWCLQHQLHSKCQQHMHKARQLRGKDERIERLEYRLARSLDQRDAPHTPATSQPPPTPPKVATPLEDDAADSQQTAFAEAPQPAVAHKLPDPFDPEIFNRKYSPRNRDVRESHPTGRP